MINNWILTGDTHGKVELRLYQLAADMLKQGFPTKDILASTGLGWADILQIIEPWTYLQAKSQMAGAFIDVKTDERKVGMAQGIAKMMLRQGHTHEHIRSRCGLTEDQIQKIQTDCLEDPISVHTLFIGSGFEIPPNGDGTYNLSSGLKKFKRISRAEGVCMGIVAYMSEEGSSVEEICTYTGLRKEIVMLLQFAREYWQ